MKLIDHLKSMSRRERAEFADRCRTTLGHINNVAYGYKPCSPELAVSVEQESGGSVTRQELRPTDWRRIWPELIGPAPSTEEAA